MIRIAYLILAHKNPHQLARLVQRLDSGADSFHLHIDKNVKQNPFRRALAHSGLTARVEWVRPFACRWAEFSIVQATLNGLTAILATSVPFDYVVLLSGQDYPIKPTRIIHEFLEQNVGKNFMTCCEMPTPFFVDGGMFRVERKFFTFLGQRRTFPSQPLPSRVQGRIFHFLQQLYFSRPTPLPPNLKLYGGAQWWCLTRAAIQYVLEYVNQNPTLCRFFQYAWAPDEIFFQTILGNAAQYRETIIFENDLHYYDWLRPTPPYPAILTTADFSLLQRSDKLYARKFDPEIDSHILDQIDAHILDARVKNL